MMSILRFFTIGIFVVTIPCWAMQTRPDKPKGDSVLTEDYNLDGYADFSIPKPSGAHGEVAEFWLWNPATRLFERNDYLSNDMNVEVDKDRKVVWTHGANSVYDSVTKEYLLDHGKVIWVLSIDQSDTYHAHGIGAFPVIRKFKIPVKGRMTTVLKLVYADEDEFKAPCERCQTLNDLKGCEILGYGRVFGQPNEGVEVIAFAILQKESVCAFYPGDRKPNMVLLPKSSVNLNGK